MEEIFVENKELKRELHQIKLKGIESALEDIILITKKDGIPFYFNFIRFHLQNYVKRWI